MIDHARFEEMSAAYALGALDAAEAAEFRAHLRQCAACMAELRDHGAVAYALAQSAPPVALPQNAKGKLLAAVAGDAAADALLRTRRPAEEAAVRPLRARRAVPAWWQGVAAAAVIVAGAVGFEDMRYRADMDRHIASARATETIDRQIVTALAGAQPVTQSWEDEARGWWCRIVMPTGGHPAMVVAVGPPPPAGRSYEVWLVRDGKPHSAGMMRTGSGMVKLPMHPAKGDMVAFTIEPASGSPAPTGDYIMTHTI